MNKKIVILVTWLAIFSFSFTQVTISETIPGTLYEGEVSINYRNLTVYAPAVATSESGYKGVISTVTVTIQNNGSGRVFVDTLPLTQIDMQGSARLAVKVAKALVKRDNISTDDYDFFFVVRTNAPIIGGPSAGGIMTVATIALLENWEIDDNTVMTGMINPDGSIGPVGGITYKIDAAASVGATRFLIPKGQGTYTEMVTVTESGSDWRRTVTKPVTKYVADYAMDNYGIEVIEVEDINEALHNYTGNFFPIAKCDEPISTTEYQSSMKPLAYQLLADAENLYQNASELFNTSSIPSNIFTDYKSQIRDVLDDADDLLQNSEHWYDKGLYYTSTTWSFQSLIDSRFVKYACEYFNSDTREEYVNNLIGEITDFYEEKKEIAENAQINGSITLQCVGAAQKRVSEASIQLEEAKQQYNDEDSWSDLNVLYKLAFAMERSRSVGWWLNISKQFNDTGNITLSEIENLSLEYIEDAQQSITYSSVILQESGISTSEISSSQELLENARDNYEKNLPASALFGALEALSKANLALENIDGDSQGKINRSRESAESSISESRDMGIEPVLAVSYYELAQSYANETSYDTALLYYKYSDIIAGALSFTDLTTSSTESRYTGIPEVNIPIWRQIFQSFDGFVTFSIILFILGSIGGFGAGVILYNGRDKTKNEKWVPRSMKKTSVKHKEEYFSDGHIPRSIEDYYKRKK